MNQLPLYIPVVFICTTILAFIILFRALGKSKGLLYIFSGWLFLQAIISLSGFYLPRGGNGPAFLLLVFPPLFFVILVLATAWGGKLTGRPDLKWLTLFHIIRIPVEIVLFWLFIHKGLPGVMTFEGRNLDILAGISAPLIYYFGFVKSRLPVGVILAWNFICLGLLLNIVVTAVLSMPFPVQQFGFEQPNIALFYFPFVWLPGGLVPLVLFAHMYSIRQLLAMKAIAVR
jgi:hypothetical protein